MNMKTQNSFTKFMDLYYRNLTKIVFSLNFFVGEGEFDVHSFSFLFKSTFTKIHIVIFFSFGIGVEEKVSFLNDKKSISVYGV